MMNLSVKGASIGSKKLNAEATLNPNSAEFVPRSLRSQAESIGILDTSSKFPTSGKSILGRSESSTSNSYNSEEEGQQFWRHQLPDDIKPDFKVMGTDNEKNSSSFPNLSLSEVDGALRYTSPKNGGFKSVEPQAFALHSVDGKSHAKPSDKQISSSDQFLASEKNPYNGNSRGTFLADSSNGQVLLENTNLCYLEFLASQFPVFAADSIAEVYFSNGGDLNLTINRLTQLEIQIDGDLNQTLSSKVFSAPNCSNLNLPALRVPDGRGGLGKLTCYDQQNVSPYWSSVKDSSPPFRYFSTDFASATRKMASQESNIWKYDRNGLSDARQVIASSYNNSLAKRMYGDRLQRRGSPLASPVRIGSGESFAHVYSEKREEGHDHARVHNSYIEQARQAYVTGNKTLAKELSILVQLHNLQMKAAMRRLENQFLFRGIQICRSAVESK